MGVTDSRAGGGRQVWLAGITLVGLVGTKTDGRVGHELRCSERWSGLGDGVVDATAGPTTTGVGSGTGVQKSLESILQTEGGGRCGDSSDCETSSQKGSSATMERNGSAKERREGKQASESRSGEGESEPPTGCARANQTGPAPRMDAQANG